MEKEMCEKIKIIKSLNNDDSRFITKVLDSLHRDKIQIEEMKRNADIVTDSSLFDEQSMINLDNIWSKPYYYTKKRRKFNKMLEILNDTNIDSIRKNLKRFCRKVVKTKLHSDFKKPENSIDIVDFIRNISNNKKLDLKYFAKSIDEETIFKKEQIEKAISIIKIEDRRKKISKIYDEVCNYLNDDFLSYNYCDFIENKCVAQRHHQLYPINKNNGCCFMQLRKCNHLYNGKCMVNCLSCKLFSCPYLSKMGVQYYANEIILLKVFFNKKQRKKLIFSFYKSKEDIMSKL